MEKRYGKGWLWILTIVMVVILSAMVAYAAKPPHAKGAEVLTKQILKITDTTFEPATNEGDLVSFTIAFDYDNIAETALHGNPAIDGIFKLNEIDVTPYWCFLNWSVLSSPVSGKTYLTIYFKLDALDTSRDVADGYTENTLVIKSGVPLEMGSDLITPTAVTDRDYTFRLNTDVKQWVTSDIQMSVHSYFTQPQWGTNDLLLYFEKNQRGVVDYTDYAKKPSIAVKTENVAEMYFDYTKNYNEDQFLELFVRPKSTADPIVLKKGLVLFNGLALTEELQFHYQDFGGTNSAYGSWWFDGETEINAGGIVYGTEDDYKTIELPFHGKYGNILGDMLSEPSWDIVYQTSFGISGLGDKITIGGSTADAWFAVGHDVLFQIKGFTGADSVARMVVKIPVGLTAYPEVKLLEGMTTPMGKLASNYTFKYDSEGGAYFFVSQTYITAGDAKDGESITVEYGEALPDIAVCDQLGHLVADANPAITYYESDGEGGYSELSTAPIDMGIYRINVAYAGDDAHLASSAVFYLSITKATPTYTVPANLTAEYGKTLGEITLPAGFTWEDDSNTTVGNVGNRTFAVTFTPADLENYNAVTGIEVTITVTKIFVTKPVLSETNFTFDGTEKTVSVAESGDYTFAGDLTETNAGSYSVTVTLADPINRVWQGGTSDVLTLTWTIQKAAGSGTISVEDVEENIAIQPMTNTSTNGAVTIMYKRKDAADSTYSAVAPNEAGVYTARAVFAATDNYEAYTATVNFKIKAVASSGCKSEIAGGSYHMAAILFLIAILTVAFLSKRRNADKK